MYLPSVQPISHPDVYINGDVQVDPQAILASGVILQAAANSRIVVKAGACLGMGTILNAYHGTIEIGTGAVLGPGVLIIGNCQIGSSSCIGTASTILDTSVEPMTMIPPGSLLGDRSHSHQGIESEFVETEPELSEAEVETETNDDLLEPPKSEKPPIIGEVYINQLLLTLFPGGKNLRKPPLDK
ncbi:hypothetical protein [Gloeocapsa sp. PCC 73106]|uniref:hypothetical protein n=1 Tax=Gloeocapsa sp. PCC 73106 TaxID=102232 RepID=UPI0002ABEE8B|nr:hypothetical protein [Gloeocapsa sp. PCC 73106]ELR99547.1 hypothetical protein GLO73106DRAFT_00033990 [Gloeocapsa sp. PCC 73106]